MQIVRTIADLRARSPAPHRSRAFVPTMGNLHEGHLALVREARRCGDAGGREHLRQPPAVPPHEDFDSYPRTWERDCAKLEAAGCDVLFAPDESELYPEPQTFKVHPPAELGRHPGRPVPARASSSACARW